MNAERHHLADLRGSEEGPAFPVVTEPAIDRINAEETEPKPQTMREIAERVAGLHNVTVDDLKGSSRLKKFAHARQEAMWAMRQAVNADGSPRFSLPQIGRFLGGRDHTTVIHGERAHAERMAGRGA
jgi:chromosomal replication initiation ATPase DnaA